MSKNIGTNISKNLSGKYSQNHDHAKRSVTDAFKTASKDKFKKEVKQLIQLQKS